MDISLKTDLDYLAHYNSAMSPLSDLPTPTKEVSKTGDYIKARLEVCGLVVNIENPYGSFRTGTDFKGKSWAIELKDSYGEIYDTEGADGDAIDIFVKPHLTVDDIENIDKIYVIDQINPNNGEFDEHKCVLGYSSIEDATSAYLSNYSDGWKGLGAITPMTLKMFKLWLRRGNTTKPIAYKPDVISESVKFAVGDKVMWSYKHKLQGDVLINFNYR